MNKCCLLLLAIAAACISGISMYGQDNKNHISAAEERIYVKASSATVLQWFGKIEQETNLVLSYDPSVIDTGRQCRIDTSGVMTVNDLLKLVLKGYHFKSIRTAPGRLALQAKKKEEWEVGGSVTETGSGERLYGAVVIAEDRRGNKRYAVTDGNGDFMLNLTDGIYDLSISYTGYSPNRQKLHVNRPIRLDMKLTPLPFEIDEVTVRSYREGELLSGISPASILSFSSCDLFSQLWILPGVSGMPTGYNFQVNGGAGDENQLLIDGIPVSHPGHMNSLFPVFNGDAVKNIVFYNGYFPTRFEGRLSSVTEVRMKEGNKQEHVRTLTLDMPAVSATFEGPIVREKLSYIASIRRSWLDFFDNLLSDENRLNHSTFDYNAKFSYSVSHSGSLEFFAYGARDEYHWPGEHGDKIPILRWSNEIYQLRYNGRIGKLGNTTSLFYTHHQNRANAYELGVESEGYIHSGITAVNISTEFSYTLDHTYNARWGAKYLYEIYDLLTYKNNIDARREPISQYSLYYDNHIHINSALQMQIGIHFVGYLPHNHSSYYSIQPRLSLRYSPSENDVLYLNFSKMEQFYHYLQIESMALPTDFRMPSIEGYKPRSSEHYETGWKHFLKSGQLEFSAYYKTRRHLLALRPGIYIEDTDWQKYLMEGNGESYGIKTYLMNTWKHWTIQFSYTYSRSKEWFDTVKNRAKLPSLYDIPHQLGCAVSYKISRRSSVSCGGHLHSGRIEDSDGWFGTLPEESFRTIRRPLTYRIDLGYSYRHDFGGNLLLLRCGLYNVLGNPPEEEVLNFYTVYWNGNCLPYAGISFRF